MTMRSLHGASKLEAHLGVRPGGPAEGQGADGLIIGGEQARRVLVRRRGGVWKT